MGWYEPAQATHSLGSQAERPKSLAGLHAARKEHLSQFFTSEKLSAFVWQIVEPAINSAYAEHKGFERIALFDNSVGSGRMLQHADPDKHTLAGIDVHQDSVDALIEAADKAGFQYDFLTSGMEDVNPYMYDVALLNPPFSIHLESPNLQPYSCTSFGRFGASTSAVSHLYAIAQALDCCSIVAAIIPTSAVHLIKEDPAMSNRLVAALRLPMTAFNEEGINVDTSIVIFNSEDRSAQLVEYKIKSLDELAPEIDLSCVGIGMRAVRSLKKIDIDETQPTITLPVTNEPNVRVGHDGRYIKLNFDCGLMQAKVMNAILIRPVPKMKGDIRHRYAKDMKYIGQSTLDIEAWLLQPDPFLVIGKLTMIIKASNGIPIIDPGLINFLEKRIRQYALQSTPLRHTVWMDNGMLDAAKDVVDGVARCTHAANEKSWASPIIKEGDSIQFNKSEVEGTTAYTYQLNDIKYTLSSTELFEKFELTSSAVEAGWTVLHEGRIKAFPEHALCLTKKAEQLGIDKILSWTDYQFNDLIEECLSPKGGIIGWKMGLGKARLALCLCLMGGKNNLITVEANLINEMITEINGIGLDESQWQVISKPEHLESLKQINIISYNRLRMPLNPVKQHKTYARMLRRRISTLVADEGHLLRNSSTQQSQAVWIVSPKKRFILSGTPINNVARNILPLAAFVHGDGTAAQPYGQYKSYMNEYILHNAAYVLRGIECFRERFVTLEWCTNEFSDDLTQGAKREVPKIKDVEGFRKYIAPLVKRRLHHEPEVAKYITIPKANILPNHYVEWDDAHLGHYLKVAKEFAGWFTAQREAAAINGKKTNLIAVLARIQAVVQACNFPQRGTSGFVAHNQITSKQEKAIERLIDLTAKGHKIIFCAHSPATLEFFATELEKRGIESVLFHGGIPITKRINDLDQHFRHGNKQILLSSYGVVQRGLNIWQADYILQYERDWSSTVEDQLIHRVLRPQQTKKVTVERLHLLGSIDDYQGQMVAFKECSLSAGLDYGEQKTENMEFLHLDTILGRFCEDLAELRGIKGHELKERLAA